MSHRDKMLRLVFAQFRRDTYTIELEAGKDELFSRSSEELEDLVRLGYISRHPGILGSSCSYYRTQKGMQAWEEMYG